MARNDDENARIKQQDEKKYANESAAREHIELTNEMSICQRWRERERGKEKMRNNIK